MLTIGLRTACGEVSVNRGIVELRQQRHVNAYRDCPAGARPGIPSAGELLCEHCAGDPIRPLP